MGDMIDRDAAIAAIDDAIDLFRKSGNVAVYDPREVIRAIPAAPMGVKVKPLEWIKSEILKSYNSKEGYTVQEEYDANGTRSWAMGRDGVLISDHDTDKAAKAAAQEDYEAHILAALTPQPAPMGGNVRSVLAEARGIMRNIQCLPPADGNLQVAKMWAGNASNLIASAQEYLAPPAPALAEEQMVQDAYDALADRRMDKPAPTLGDALELAQRVCDTDAEPERVGRYSDLRKAIGNLRATLAALQKGGDLRLRDLGAADK
jgi:hypothetical protein